jgi:hypothetical protein
MLEELLFADTESFHVAFLHEPRTPSRRRWRKSATCWSGSASAELETPVHHWFHAYVEACEQEFTAEPDRVAVTDKQIQPAEEQKVWLYATINSIRKSCLRHHFLTNAVESL